MNTSDISDVEIGTAILDAAQAPVEDYSETDLANAAIKARELFGIDKLQAELKAVKAGRFADAQVYNRKIEDVTKRAEEAEVKLAELATTEKSKQEHDQTYAETKVDAALHAHGMGQVSGLRKALRLIDQHGVWRGTCEIRRLLSDANMDSENTVGCEGGRGTNQYSEEPPQEIAVSPSNRGTAAPVSQQSSASQKPAPCDLFDITTAVKAALEDQGQRFAEQLAKVQRAHDIRLAIAQKVERSIDNHAVALEEANKAISENLRRAQIHESEQADEITKLTSQLHTVGQHLSLRAVEIMKLEAELAAEKNRNKSLFDKVRHLKELSETILALAGG